MEKQFRFKLEIEWINFYKVYTFFFFFGKSISLDEKRLFLISLRWLHFVLQTSLVNQFFSKSYSSPLRIHFPRKKENKADH